MSTAQTTRAAWQRLPLDTGVLLLCALALAGVAALEGFPPGFVVAFVLLALLRLTLGRDGRALLPDRLYRPVAVAATAFSLAWLFLGIVTSGPHHALLALMSAMCIFQGLVLLARRSVFGGFLLILFSSVHAAGTAFSFPNAYGLVLTFAYVAVLIWTLILFERKAAYAREEGLQGAVLFLRPQDAQALPMGTALRTLAALVFLGFPIGLALYLIVPPRSFFDPAEGRMEDGGSSEYADGDVEGKTELPGGSFETPTAALTGPGKGVPLGSVSLIKKDITPMFQVELADGADYPPVVILRDNTCDHCRADGLWTDTLSGAKPDRAYRDLDDGRRDGWVPLGHPDRPSTGHVLRITMLRGGQRRLYLQPDEVRIQVLRKGRSRTGYVVSESANETLSVDFPIQAGDQVLQRTVAQVPAGMRLEGRRSDRAISPLPSYLQLPEESEAALRRIALRVAGSEQDPWRRALALERWLNGEAFRYTLQAPPIDRRDPVVDFLERTRSGSCSYYATALTLLLRALGHPARYVRGFWGGDRMEETSAVVLRGYHYHAWTELYLDGIGWVPLNPTPPERATADGGTRTAAAAGPEEESGFHLLLYDKEQWARLWSAAGTWVATWILDPLAVLFSGAAGFAGYPLLLLLVLLSQRRLRALRTRRRATGPGRRLPQGAYGSALLLLARKGLVRRPAATAREFRRFVIQRLPETSRALAALTRLHEAECFGGGASAEERALGARALRELEGVLQGAPEDARAPAARGASGLEAVGEAPLH